MKKLITWKHQSLLIEIPFCKNNEEYNSLDYDDYKVFVIEGEKSTTDIANLLYQVDILFSLVDKLKYEDFN